MSATSLALLLLSIAAALCVARLVRRGSIADRIVALDSLLVMTVSAIAVQSARTGEGTYLDALVLAALLGFTATITVARFIERRGA